MQIGTNPFSVMLVKLLAFCLDIFRNAQFVNFSIFCFLYFLFFFLTITGLFFSFYADTTSAFIVWVSQVFLDPSSNATVRFAEEGTTLVRYYVYLILFLGVCQELVLSILEKVFKKNLRGVLEKNKRASFFTVTILCLILELVTSFFLKDWWISLIGGVSFAVLIILYLWYRLVQRVVHMLKNAVIRI